MVLCYYLQHPYAYSPAGLAHAIGLLVNFLQEGISPKEVVRRSRAHVDSGKHSWKITSRSGVMGVYAHPQTWSVTIQDVAAGGLQGSTANVWRWAQDILWTLRNAGNLPGKSPAAW
jgi:hypothetical protein